MLPYRLAEEKKDYTDFLFCFKEGDVRVTSEEVNCKINKQQDSSLPLKYKPETHLKTFFNQCEQKGESSKLNLSAFQIFSDLY